MPLTDTQNPSHDRHTASGLKPWTAPRLESLDVASTLTGSMPGKEGAGKGNEDKKLLS
jgi:hypothetical protein